MDSKRIEQLEMVTQRLMRRSGKKTTALITPYPISNAVFGDKVEGPILRYMFPCDGVITKGMICLGAKPKHGVSLVIKIFNESSSGSKGFMVDKKRISVSPSLPVVAGDCLEITLIPSSVDDIITEVWISFLWKPEVKDVEAKSYLIEEIENDLQKIEMRGEESLPGSGKSSFND